MGTTRVMVCCGDGAGVFDVRRVFGRVACREVAWVPDPSDQRAVDQARSAAARAGSAKSVVLVIGAADVHLRPMALSSALFESARPEIERSLESLMPIEPDRARLGFVDRAEGARADGDDESDGAGYLLGMEAAVAAHWREVSTRLVGKAPDRMVGSHQAALCAGFQGAERAIVRERGAFGELQDSVLEHGVYRELRRDADRAVQPDLLLPSGGTEADRASAARLAVGAAALDSYASRETIPLEGGWTPQWKRAVPAALLTLGCIGLLLAALSIREARYDTALASTLAEQERIRPEVAAAERAAADRDRLGELLSTAVGSSIARDASAMEIVAAVERALPQDAFLEQLSVNGNGVRLRGIAASARDVLAAIEASELLVGAREGERPQPIGDGSGREMFDVRADFRAGAGGAS